MKFWDSSAIVPLFLKEASSDSVGWVVRSEILPSERVRKRAERLLKIHRLRAADALQLASALIWAEEDPQGLEIVCLDQNLRDAASREGFTVLP